MRDDFFDGYSIQPLIVPAPGEIGIPAENGSTIHGPQEGNDSCVMGAHQGTPLSNISEYDLTGDGRIDRLSIDVNRDGIADVEINCVPGLVRGEAFPSYVGAGLPDIDNPAQIGGSVRLDLDGDGIPDAVGLDLDGDGVVDKLFGPDDF